MLCAVYEEDEDEAMGWGVGVVEVGNERRGRGREGNVHGDGVGVCGIIGDDGGAGFDNEMICINMHLQSRKFTVLSSALER